MCVEAGSGSSYILRQSLSLEPECADLASLASQLDLDVTSPSLPSDGWNHRLPCPSRPASTWVLGIQTLILRLAQQVLKPASQPGVKFLMGVRSHWAHSSNFVSLSIRCLHCLQPIAALISSRCLYSKAHGCLPLQQALKLPLCLPSSTISLSLLKTAFMGYQLCTREHTHST